MDNLKKPTESILALPVALLFQNSETNEIMANEKAKQGSNVDNSMGSISPSNGSNGNILIHSVNNGKSFPSNSLEKISDVIRRELKWGFILHTYGFGCLFFILAFYTFFSILNLRSFISSRPFMSTINGFLCLLGASRAGSLFIDPYNLKETMPKIIGQILWDLGFPSIISAFCLVQLAFLQLTQLKIGPESLRRKSCLSLVVAAHFMLTIGMDIIVASHENLLIVKYVIQYIFLTWGVILCCSFLYSGYKVMSMIRNIPGGFKHRDLPDPNHKGIMQLAMLAPHNNLAGSVTAALLPTLCAPKIHQQDNTSTSTMGFRNEGNSRILESESIPMLEEMAGSSGDERSPQPLTRGSSFQNQTRNTQKFNLKPKLSLRSSPDSEQNDEMYERVSSPKASKPQVLKSPPSRYPGSRPNKFDFPVKSSNGILKNAEPFVTTKDIQEFKTKIHSRGSSDNEQISRSSSDKRPKAEGEVRKSENFESLIPDILISSASRSNSSEIVSDGGQDKKDKGEESRDAPPKQTGQNDEEKGECKPLLKCGSKKEKNFLNAEVQGKCKMRSESERRGSNSRRASDSSRRGSQNSEGGSRSNSCRYPGSFRGRRSMIWEDGKFFDSFRGSNKDSNSLMVDIYPDRRSSDSSALSEIESTDSPCSSVNMRERRKGKSLTWKKKSNERGNPVQECLLPQENVTTDVSLSAILNHIAYVNRAALTADSATQEELEKVRKSKVEWVLNVTYITAMWGLMLCLSNMGRIYSPYGTHEPRYIASTSFPNATNGNGGGEHKSGGLLSSPWPWLWFQTFCRALELAMGCAMANITRQPTATYRNPHTFSIRHRDTLYNI